MDNGRMVKSEIDNYARGNVNGREALILGMDLALAVGQRRQ